MRITLLKSTQDILSPSVILFVLKIALLSLLGTFVVTWVLWDILHSLVTTYISWISWGWLNATITSVASIFIAYTLFIMQVSLFTSLMSESLIIQLAKRHYPARPVTGNSSLVTSLLITLKASTFFLLLFILLFPLLFIPIVGQLVMLYLWSILLKAPTVYDVGTLFISEKTTLKAETKQATTIALIASLFNYIPILNLFAPIFAQILFLHHIMRGSR